MRQIRTDKNGQQYDTLHEMPVHYCRTCSLKMFEPNKGFDYRCAACHEKAIKHEFNCIAEGLK